MDEFLTKYIDYMFYKTRRRFIEGVTAFDYLHSYDITIQTISVAGTPQDVVFGFNHHINGWTHTLGTADFLCANTGLYKLDYTAFFEKTGGGPAIFEVEFFVDGVEQDNCHSSSDVTINNDIKTSSNNAIFDCSAGQIIKFKINSTTTFVRLSQHAAGEPVFNFSIIRLK